MIALLFAALTVVLFMGRRELSDLLAGLIARFTGGAK
jgi:hypothetical protein